jgi:hypothetical protein
MALNDDLRQVTLKNIEQLDINNLPIYSITNSKSINFMRETGIVDDLSLEKALEVAVLARAKNDLFGLSNRSNYMPYIKRPECLVYAIQQGVITKRELSRVNFINKEPIESYCRRYIQNNLLQNLREELLKPTSLLLMGGDTAGQRAYFNFA